MESSHKEKLYAFKPQHSSPAGIDSGGCVVHSMEIKHNSRFITNIIKMKGDVPGDLSAARANGSLCFPGPYCPSLNP
jgi:hypothetical protein